MRISPLLWKADRGLWNWGIEIWFHCWINRNRWSIWVWYWKLLLKWYAVFNKDTDIEAQRSLRSSSQSLIDWLIDMTRLVASCFGRHVNSGRYDGLYLSRTLRCQYMPQSSVAVTSPSVFSTSSPRCRGLRWRGREHCWRSHRDWRLRHALTSERSRHLFPMLCLTIRLHSHSVILVFCSFFKISSTFLIVVAHISLFIALYIAFCLFLYHVLCYLVLWPQDWIK